jgi:WD40 repeat protein
MTSRRPCGFVVAILLASTALHADERAIRSEHGARCRAVAFSPDGRWLATAGGGSVGDVKIWDVKTGDEVAAWEAHAGRTTAVAFSPDSKHLVAGGVDATPGQEGGVIKWWVRD